MVAGSCLPLDRWWVDGWVAGRDMGGHSVGSVC